MGESGAGHPGAPKPPTPKGGHLARAEEGQRLGHYRRPGDSKSQKPRYFLSLKKKMFFICASVLVNLCSNSTQTVGRYLSN